MYYRRKILLSLINEFGGLITKTDCQKLMFLFCEQTRNSYYDFFPYKYGAFSHVLYDDKRQLMRLGWLKNEEEYTLSNSKRMENELEREDQIALAAFKREVKGTRGKKLVRKVYLEFPRLAYNSEILSKVLSPVELEKVKRSWKKDDSMCLFTLGYEGKSIDYYLDQLVAHNVKVLIDVRKNPISRKFGFSKNKLSRYVSNLKIRYIHMPELGIPSKLRKKLEGRNAYDRLFRYYRNHLLPEQEDAIIKIREILGENKRLALMCFEADHTNCHRHIIAEALMNKQKYASSIKHLA